MIEFSFNNSTSDKRFGPNFFKKVLAIAAQACGLEKHTIGLSVNLVGKARIKTLNKYRMVSSATDVLAFPLNKSWADSKDSDIIELGDIFLCLPVIEKRAKKAGQSHKESIGRAVIHGFLHLIGHSHDSSAGERKMTTLESKILKKI